MFTWLKNLFGMKEDSKILQGDGTWGFTAIVDGDDVVVRGAQATWFGGENDPQDFGETASGVNTKRRPDVQGCAIPMNFGPCKGSPLPRVPWGTKVEVVHLKSGKMISVPVIDLGPAHDTGHALDLTPAAFKQFAPLADGKVEVDFRVLGAAKRLLA